MSVVLDGSDDLTIYAMGYVDFKGDGPLVIEVPPGLQGILDDFWQRGICSEGEIEGRVWCGDIGLPGPDHGKGGKCLLLPPDYRGTPPHGYFTVTASSVPEPSSLLLLGTGMAGIIGVTRRKMNQ